MEKRSRTGSGLVTKNYILEKIVARLQRALGENLVYIISSGSAGLGVLIHGWSDIDFVIIIRKMTLNNKLVIARILQEIQRKYKVKLGGLVITIKELRNPDIPLVSLDGKILQTILELDRGKQVMIFGKKPLIYFRPDRKQVRKWSLNSIGQILWLHRRNILKRNFNREKTPQEQIEQSIHYALNITKLAIQFFRGRTCYSDEQLLNHSSKMFPTYLIKDLKRIISYKSNWPDSIKTESWLKILNIIDNYIEKCSSYVFKKV